MNEKRLPGIKSIVLELSILIGVTLFTNQLFNKKLSLDFLNHFSIRNALMFIGIMFKFGFLEMKG
jgi:hypothetical protein